MVVLCTPAPRLITRSISILLIEYPRAQQPLGVLPDPLAQSGLQRRARHSMAQNPQHVTERERGDRIMVAELLPDPQRCISQIAPICAVPVLFTVSKHLILPDAV